MSNSTFRTAVVRTPGGPDSIEIINVPIVEPGPGEIRVEVRAASVNPVDLGVANGLFHQMGLINQPQHTGLGWDFAGIVAATGLGVDLEIGTRVAGMVAGFDRDYSTCAEQVTLPAADVAIVPDSLAFEAATTLPLNGLAAAQIVDLLGVAEPGANRLLVTGAAGQVGAFVASLAPEHGWQVTGLAREADEEFVRSLGANHTSQLTPGWDAVADCAKLQNRGLALVRDSGAFVGVVPNGGPAPERGIRVSEVVSHPDGHRLAKLLAKAASGRLPVRVHAVLPLDRIAEAFRDMSLGGVRGRFVIAPDA